jgi:hypothetical protein
VQVISLNDVESTINPSQRNEEYSKASTLKKTQTL